MASSIYSLVSSSVTDCECGHVLHSWPLGTVMENRTSLEIRISVKSTGHYLSFILIFLMLLLGIIEML